MVAFENVYWPLLGLLEVTEEKRNSHIRILEGNVSLLELVTGLPNA